MADILENYRKIKATEETNHRTPWIKPLVILFLVSFFIYGFNRLVDYILIKNDAEFLGGVIFDTDLGNLTNSISALGEVVTAILGIEITAIAIIVQLAANKYSSKVMDVFVSNNANIFAIGLFVVTGVNTILVTNTMTSDFITFWSIGITLLFIIFSLLLVLPHFNYVFNFLRPQNFLYEVKKDTLKTIRQLCNSEKKYSKSDRDEVHENINFIGDVALNSVYQGDRATTLLCLSTLREILEAYFPLKNCLPEDWFKLSGDESLDPDFSNYSHFVMEKIEHRKILLERKVFRLYEMIYNNSRVTLKDVASGVLLNSDLIAQSAIDNNDDGALKNCFQYFNSYLRSAINGRDPRSAFNTFEHYRMVAEKLLDTNPKEVEKLSFFFKYYGQEANKFGVLFILETAAHDLMVLNKIAYLKRVENMKDLLEMFLTLDQPIEDVEEKEIETKERSLIGVRISQAKLAAFYISKNDNEFAKIIFNDMQVEPISRIRKIRDLIFNTKEEEFWEITPRGINFYFASDDSKESLREFFSWFENGNQP
ncbi:MAG: DUF2254 domain-containing protein [Melioribacteraceae bacterium]|nr:DUF2254 domain-containing protein [Melioribacteraceae bacterium]MCF8354843.1 DUF2254 domain-containing protein [Melioribacteraceae bacterium]MCF8392950.1 DUF2254 domain-containing protein [Melioribacteraceae bacterium]MCF8417307.1 DUF2254 domain-containing protein [Melioribacteraceae bacterium]